MSARRWLQLSTAQPRAAGKMRYDSQPAYRRFHLCPGQRRTPGCVGIGQCRTSGCLGAGQRRTAGCVGIRGLSCARIQSAITTAVTIIKAPVMSRIMAGPISQAGSIIMLSSRCSRFLPKPRGVQILWLPPTGVCSGDRRRWGHYRTLARTARDPQPAVANLPAPVKTSGRGIHRPGGSGAP